MPIKLQRKISGSQVEAHACKWLKKRGLSLLGKNYHCYRGEIDLIMLDRQCLVFIEVRYRRQNSFGRPEETVNRKKQMKIMLTAEHFLLSHSQHQGKSCRFDVIAAQPDSSGGKLRFHWIRDAFCR